MTRLITYQMLQREAIRQAYGLGLEPNFNNTDAFRFMYYDNIKRHKFEYQGKHCLFGTADLTRSIDDFAEYIIQPFLLAILNNDLKFIHLDCT